MIQKWSEGVADDNMSEDILTDLSEIIQRHPWWQARAKLVKTLLGQLGIQPPAQILDAGCGWGVTLAALEDSKYQVTGCDISRRALDRLDRPNRLLVEADLTKPIPDNCESYDAILALDVIEHLDDDRGALINLAKLVRPNGVIIVSVPALPEMFSEFDAIQGHRRRYLPDTLRAAFNDTGLMVERVFFWGRWLVPLLQRQRHRQVAQPGESVAETYRRYLTLPPWPVIQVFRLAFALEQRSALKGKLQSGTSLYAVARRSGQQSSS